jgi:hypothetical protein
MARYMELVTDFPLRPLRSERDLDRAIKIAHELAVRGNQSQGELYLGLTPRALGFRPASGTPKSIQPSTKLGLSIYLSKTNFSPRWPRPPKDQKS